MSNRKVSVDRATDVAKDYLKMGPQAPSNKIDKFLKTAAGLAFVSAVSTKLSDGDEQDEFDNAYDAWMSLPKEQRSKLWEEQTNIPRYEEYLKDTRGGDCVDEAAAVSNEIETVVNLADAVEVQGLPSGEKRALTTRSVSYTHLGTI